MNPCHIKYYLNVKLEVKHHFKGFLISAKNQDLKCVLVVFDWEFLVELVKKMNPA